MFLFWTVVVQAFQPPFKQRCLLRGYFDIIKKCTINNFKAVMGIWYVLPK